MSAIVAFALGIQLGVVLGIGIMCLLIVNREKTYERD